MLKNKVKAAVVLSILSGAVFVYKQAANAAIRKTITSIAGAAASASRSLSQSSRSSSNGYKKCK